MYLLMFCMIIMSQTKCVLLALQWKIPDPELMPVNSLSLWRLPFPISSWPYGMLECFEKTHLSHHLGIMLYEVEMLSLPERVYVLNQWLCFFFNSYTGVRIKMFMWGLLISYQTTYLQNVCFCFLFPRFLGLLFNFSTKWHNLMALLN